MRRLLLVNCKVLSFTAADPAKAILSFSKIFLLALTVFTTLHINAQAIAEKQSPDYKKAITERASKIVNTLSITDSVKYKKVVSIISGQYFSLNTIQEQNAAAVSGIKTQTPDKDRQAEALKGQEEKKAASLVQLHNDFIALLKNNLDEGQVDKVKDGMTYRVFLITYTAYQEMIPALTAEQKEKIYAWLKEARELAMDAESSDKKHAVFGKYKGRINNYLSGAGYDMKKEGEEWQKRIKERQGKNKELSN